MALGRSVEGLGLPPTCQAGTRQSLPTRVPPPPAPSFPWSRLRPSFRELLHWADIPVYFYLIKLDTLSSSLHMFSTVFTAALDWIQACFLVWFVCFSTISNPHLIFLDQKHNGNNFVLCYSINKASEKSTQSVFSSAL